MARPRFTLPYDAGAAVKGRRIVKFKAAGVVEQASAAGDDVIGVSERFDVPNGARIDVVHGGSAEVEAGGAVARGKMVGADADGKGVAVSAANNRAVGIALETAADGDYFEVLICPSQIK